MVFRSLPTLVTLFKFVLLQVLEFLVWSHQNRVFWDGLVCVGHLGGDLLYELLMKTKISRLFFFYIVSIYLAPR